MASCHLERSRAPGLILIFISEAARNDYTRAAREAPGGRRLSIEERYYAKEDYLRRVQQTAEALVEQGYPLVESSLR